MGINYDTPIIPIYPSCPSLFTATFLKWTLHEFFSISLLNCSLNSSGSAGKSLIKRAFFSIIVKSTYTQGKMAAYFAYFDSWQTQQQDRVWKYAAPTSFGMDEDNLNNLKGYWCQAYQPGNLTLPSAGGTPDSATYNWSDLLVRDSNGDIKNLEDAENYNWIEKEMIYYENGFYNKPLTGTGISPWIGYFMYSYQDNMTLLRRNT